MIDKITNNLDTIPRLLTHRVAQTPHAIAFMEKQANAWKGISWQQFYGKATRLARKFVISGVKPGDGLAILMANSIAWEIVQHAGFMAGCVVIGLDQKDPPERLARTIHMARIRVLAIQSPKMLEKIPPALFTSLKLVLVGNGLKTIKRHGRMKGLSDPKAGPKRLPRIEKTQCATLLFTSGTTGAPKAIPYDHDQLAEAVKAISLQIQDLPDQAHSACWLPLSSPFQRMINYCGLLMNHQTFMVPDSATLMADVQEIAPHFIAAVPRFYEKIYETLSGQTIEHPIPGPRTLFGKNLRFFISGSAPLSCSLLEKFHAGGWRILESYGVSENIVPMSMNTLTAYQLGTVGKPLPQNTVKIARDGEVLVKGIGVARKGVCLTHDGYLKTGDAGAIDENGYLRLTGRKSDEFKLSTGRRISPLVIESRLTRIRSVDHAVIEGARHKYIVALLAISLDAWQKLCRIHGSEKRLRHFIRQEIDRVTQNLPAHFRPVAFGVIHTPFSVETGELTQNFKVRRNHVLDAYRTQFNALHKGE